MEAIFLALIQRLNSSVFVLILILIVIGYLLVMLGKWSEKFLHQENRIGGLEGLSNEVIRIGTIVDLIYGNTNPNKTVRPRSPISLTEVGSAIAENISADLILKKYEEKLLDLVEKATPRNAYDIQSESMKVARDKMMAFLEDKEIILIKDEAYKRGLIVEDVLSIFGVLLRDVVLKKKGITVSEVDLHAPKEGT